MYYARMVRVFAFFVISTALGLVGYSQPGYGNVFTESVDSDSFDVGDFFDSASEPLLLPDIDTIRGASTNGLDIDLYQLSLTESFSDISVSIAGGRRGLNLFNDVGQFLSPVEPVSSLSFSGEAGDTFFLAIDGVLPVVSDTAPLTLLGWDTEGQAGITDVVEYEVTLQYGSGPTTQVSEPMSVVGLVIIGGLACLARQTRESVGKQRADQGPC
ncbi:MAG: hypothetical protein F6K31_04310 [Symploca sp. SIO2G7]|nr:hypothetical protein [Symploca sp. SIO2G7]